MNFTDAELKIALAVKHERMQCNIKKQYQKIYDKLVLSNQLEYCINQMNEINKEIQAYNIQFDIVETAKFLMLLFVYRSAHNPIFEDLMIKSIVETASTLEEKEKALEGLTKAIELLRA